MKGWLVLAAFVAALALYGATRAPGVTWGDPGKQALLVEMGQLSPLAAEHPLRTALGILWDRAFPWPDAAAGQNWLSAVFGAAAVALLLLLALRLGATPFAAAAAAAALAVSHLLWWVSTVAESYSLTTLILLATVLAWDACRRSPSHPRLAVAAALWGLGVSNSLLFLLTAPVWGIAFLAPSGPGTRTFRAGVVLPAAAFGAGLLLFLWVRALFQNGCPPAPLYARDVIAGTLDLRYADSLFILHPLECLRGLARIAGATLYQFPGPAILLILAGARTLWRGDRGLALLLAGLVGTVALFASTYMAQRAFFIFQPAAALTTLALPAGLAAIETRLPLLRAPAGRAALLAALMACPPAAYLLAPPACEQAGFAPFTARDLPYRDNLRYFLRPWKRGETGALRYAREALDRLPEGAVLYGDFTPLIVLQEVQGRERPALRIRWRSIEGIDPLNLGRDLREGPVYLADLEPAYRPDLLSKRFEIVADGPVFRLERKR